MIPQLSKLVRKSLLLSKVQGLEAQESWAAHLIPGVGSLVIQSRQSGMHGVERH